MIARDFRAALFAVVMLSLGVSAAGHAGSLEDMMKEDSGASAQDSGRTQSQGSGATLEDLVNGSQGSGGAASTGSLLDGIERDRVARKMQAAGTAFETYQTDIARRCECVRRGNCGTRWNDGSWDGDAEYRRNESAAIQNMRRVCEQAGREGRSDGSLAAVQERTAQAKEQLASLKKISADMAGDAQFAKYRDELHREEQRTTRRRTENKRAARARKAEDEAWLERTWGSSSGISSDEESWNKIQAIADNTMANVRENQRVHQQRKAAAQREQAARHAQERQAAANNRMDVIVQTCARNGGRYNHSTDRCDAVNRLKEKRSSTHTAEKQNCLNAGKKWTGSACDYSSTVVVQGWKKGNSAAVQKSAQSAAGSLSSSGGQGRFDSSARESDPGGPNRPGMSLEDLVNPGSSTGSAGSTASSQYGSKPKNTGGGAGSSNSGGSGGGSNADKYGPRLMPVIDQEEGAFGWSTEEEACTHAKAAVIRKATKECKEQLGGRVATKAEIGMPVDANCVSYRQMEKSGFGGTKGQWKVTGKVILQCRLPEKPFANPIAPDS